MEPATSSLPVGFTSAAPRRELPVAHFKVYLHWCAVCVQCCARDHSLVSKTSLSPIKAPPSFGRLLLACPFAQTPCSLESVPVCGPSRSQCAAEKESHSGGASSDAFHNHVFEVHPRCDTCEHFVPL